MASDESPENNSKRKKLKVIDWGEVDNLTAEPDSEAGGEERRKPNWILRTGVLLLVSFVAFVGIRGWQVYNEMKSEMETQTAQAGSNLSTGNAGELGSQSFISRPRAQLARDDAYEKIQDARRSIDGNSLIMQRLISVEKTFQEGERFMSAREYRAAFEKFQETEQLLDNFNQEISNKNAAFETRDDFLALKDKLEPHRHIARETYEEAYIQFSEGIYFLDNGSFLEAKNRFDDALESLKILEERVGRYKERKLIEGQEALASGNAREAMSLFNEVLEIDEDNEAAKTGLTRAETLEQVFPMLEQAEALEEEGQLVKANELYVSAYDLDPHSARAQAGAARTERKVKELAFEKALLEAVEAAEDKNWQLAIEASERALEVYPDNEEVKERLEEFRELEFEARVNNALEKARDLEFAREWRLAQDAYEEALKLAPNNEEAIEGIRRTGDISRAVIRYEKLVELAQLEAANNLDFQASINYFNEAMSIKPDYLSLSQEAGRLKDFLNRQSKPVSLTITSDGRTWVSISGYDHLGKFREKNIKILPGRYRIVGRRKGYEDAVRNVTIVAGEGLWVDNQKRSNWEVSVVPSRRDR